jgi:hypothetical protein
MLAKVTSLFDLFNKARTNKAYEQLAMIAARNLGGDNIKTLADAERWLNITANDSGDCQGVVGEVNFCRDLVKEDGEPKKPLKRRINVEKIRQRLNETERRYIFSDAAADFEDARNLAIQTGETILVSEQTRVNRNGDSYAPSVRFVPISGDFVLRPVPLNGTPIGGSVTQTPSDSCPLCDAGIPLSSPDQPSH